MKAIGHNIFSQFDEDKQRLMYYHFCCMLSLLVSLFRIVFTHLEIETCC